MAKDTLRDRVWGTALEFATESGKPEPISDFMPPDGFTKRQLKDAVDASDRTVHDVLKTMVDYGYLEQEEQRVAVPRGDDSAIHHTTVYSGTLPEHTQGKDTQKADEQVSDTPDTGESDIDDELSEDTLEVSRGIVNYEPVIEPASKTHDIDQLPFDKHFERLSDLPNVSRKRRINLVTSGFKSFNDIYVASVDELTETDGIGTATARKMTISIADIIRQKRDIPYQDIAKESIEYIIDEYNLDEQSAEEWLVHAQAKASQNNDDKQIADALGD
jgi:hypothetical protein